MKKSIKIIFPLILILLALLTIDVLNKPSGKNYFWLLGFIPVGLAMFVFGKKLWKKL